MSEELEKYKQTMNEYNKNCSERERLKANLAAAENKIAHLDQGIVNAQVRKEAKLKEIAKGYGTMGDIAVAELELDKAAKARRINDDLISAINTELTDIDSVISSLYSRLQIAYNQAWQPIYEKLKTKLRQAAGKDFQEAWIAYISHRNVSSNIQEMAFDIFGNLPEGEEKAKRIQELERKYLQS